MMKKLAGVLLCVVLLGPAVGLVSIGTLLTSSSNAECTIPSTEAPIHLGDIPDELHTETAHGETLTLNQTQLTHAATIVETGDQTQGIGEQGIIIALMAGLTESSMKMLSNTTAYPESEDYPHDGDGSDHDSLGIFQMRPETGWGSVEDLMNPHYQAQAFYGGPEGPNHGSPRGLLDIPGWEDLDAGEAAQAVEVSAHPERYQNYEPVAEDILEALTDSNPSNGTSEDGGDAVTAGEVSETSRVVFPVPEDTWLLSDEFGPRTHPVTGEESNHTGTDFAAPDGTPIFAAADGIVTQASHTESAGGIVVIEHQVNGSTIATKYIHSWEHGIHVTTGETVTAGDHIADVGSSGVSTGPHLHFEVLDGGTEGEPIDPTAWLNDHDAADLSEASFVAASTEGCEDDSTGGTGGEADPVGDGEPNRMIDDPTSDGQITARMRHVYQQTLEEFPDTSWACYEPRPGQDSDHPLGRACDVTFGNPLGSFPTETQRETGWEVTYWVQDNAETLGIDYLIWDGSIWVTSRANEGWRDYDGGGMHDPDDPTGGHYDHLHISVSD